jgi:beta-N-acetylhexosaminidase
MHDLLRGALRFGGVSITDAMDMRALAQGVGQVVEAIAALRAGVDLLLLTPDRAAQRRLEAGLSLAAQRRLVPAAHIREASARILALRRWAGRFPWGERADIRSAAHEALAHEAAARAITLVRDEDALLPLRLAPGDRVAVITPQPRDLTPADSSVTEPLDLAAAVARRHPEVLDVRTASLPTDGEIAAARAAALGCRVAIVGSIATGAQPAQARLVSEVVATGTPTVTVALRTPYDLIEYPAARTHICTYAIVPSAVEALAAALFGTRDIGGRLPVPISGLYPRGHGIDRPRVG